jgi:hypothetical protein
MPGTHLKSLTAHNASCELLNQRLLDPSLATTTTGTLMPVVVLVLNSIWDRISTVALLGTCDRRGHLGRLREPYVVTEWIAQPAVDPIGPLRGLLGKLHALRSKLLVGLPAVGRREEQVSARCTFGYEFADLLGCLCVERRGTRLLEQDLAGVARNVNGQPAHESQVLVGIDL